MSALSARAVRIDWAKVDATSKRAIARHAHEDDRTIPSGRAWRTMLRESRGYVGAAATVDVHRIRAKRGLSQAEFAARFGFTTAAVRQWEPGRHQPHGPARVLLTVIDREPAAVRRALLLAAE